MTVAAAAPARFDLAGPLPRGVTVLEASAGTGKTFTIASLATRYVAEGTPLDRLLLVTFTRMATGELRERVRDRLVRAEEGLAGVEAGLAPPVGDDLVRLLAEAGPGEVAERRARLTRALTEFDAASIATTHGFCQEVLQELGTSGDVERDVAFVEDVGDLLEEVVDDLLVRHVRRPGAPPSPVGRRDALAIARLAVDNPGARLEPGDAAPDSIPDLRMRLARGARDELERRKRRLGVMTYDDFLTRLRATLDDRVRGPDALARLRARFAVALIDEFQDTDPIQWDILRTAFGGHDATLVLIGDPKQAIYAFRGADVHAYLGAARIAGTRATLEVNWRSDGGLLAAYDALFGNARLGHPEIPYRSARPVPANAAPRLVGAPASTPLRLRVLHRSDDRLRLTKNGFAQADSARETIAADLGADVARLLSARAEIVTRDDAGAETARAALAPRDVAVLVRTNKEAATVRQALDDAGVPAVVAGTGSVFATPSAADWSRLLEALERPASPGPARAAALSAFLGWSATRVATADDADWEELHARLSAWSGVLRRRGAAALLETISRAERLPERVLARPTGERDLTDLRHLGQLLHAAAAADALGAPALAAWLRERMAEAARDGQDEERSRRLESDAEAVQVLTVHRSKGLEFGVVYLPYAWAPGWIADGAVPIYHDPGREGRRTIDVGGQAGPGHRAHCALHTDEQRGEDLRLLYVALTRARHQAVVWWAGAQSACHSALGRLLFARDDAGTVATKGSRTPDDDAVARRLERLAALAPEHVRVERPGGDAAERWSAPGPVPTHLEAARLGRDLDRHWRRTSYSAITSPAYEPWVASEPEEDSSSVDEAPVPALEGGGAPAPAGPVSPLAEMPAGTEVGTFVHRVMEAVDFSAGDLGAELRAGIDAERRRWRVDVGDPATLAAGLAAAMGTPLGPLVGGLRLHDVGPGDRLDELGFELPLVGGDRPHGALLVDDLASLLEAHLPDGHPLAGYPERLRDPILQPPLRGYLVGSIDLVARHPGPEGAPRFTVVDYKTNRLHPTGRAGRAGDYAPGPLGAAMRHAHYPLQALLYLVALHRYLRWRLPGYAAGRHLGGVLYLFLRGMGPGAPEGPDGPAGVFGWRPPAALVESLSDLLDRGPAG